MSKQNQLRVTPERGAQHDVLDVFRGDWKAEGLSFASPDQNVQNPRGNSTQWTSTHSTRWHTGQFFLIQNERAQVNGSFDTLSVLGWDEDADRYFASTFDNHGFYRHYDVTVEGNVWTISGKTERARIELSDAGKRQTINWEWQPKDTWLPLCDRIATKL